jgi:hypothetical protein
MTFWRYLLAGSALITAFAAHAQEGTTGISMVEGAPVTASPWGVSFFSLATAPQNQIGQGASVFAYNYLGLNYKLTKSRRFSIRPVFQYTSSGLDNRGNNAKSGTVLGDAHFVYADYDIGTLGPATVSTSFKFYAPTSDSSQANGTLLKFRPETFISMNVGRYDSLTYVVKPDFYVQSRFSNFSEGKYPKEFTTKVFEIEHYLEYGLSFSKTFRLKPSAGFLDTFNNVSKNPKVPSRATFAKLALGLDIYAMRGLSFTISAENKFSVADRRDDVAVMRPEESSLLLITSASL